jgi:diguanylate cyclase (GGDEF)-like protein
MKMNHKRLEDFRLKSARPIESVFWMGIVGITLLAWFLPITRQDRYHIIGLAVVASLFVIVLYHFIVPKYGVQSWVNHLLITGAIFIISSAAYLLEPYDIDLEILYIGVIAGIGILAGKKIAFRAALLSAIGMALVIILKEKPTNTILLKLAMDELAILLAGFLVISIAGMLHDQILLAEAQNRNLTLLHQAGNFTAKSENLRRTLQSIAELVVKELPTTTCRISLLSAQGDSLETYGAYPMNSFQGWKAGIGASLPLASLPLNQEAVESGRSLVVQDVDADRLISQEEKSAYFFETVKTACLIPLVAKGQPVGIISVGEARSLRREPFSDEKLNLLQSIASQVSSLVYNAQLFQASRQQAERLEALNKVTQAIGSTIELDQLLELIFDQLSSAIVCDTYYVTLYDPAEQALDFHILLDDGKRYPPARIPIGNGLASWVIENKRPLLISQLSKEIDSLPVKPVKLGQNRYSESWLGVPMMQGDQILGMLAIASYKANAFNQEDRDMLSNVAVQAALAIDNARHHAEVEEQARRDSLTGAYNHGYLLQRLSEEVDLARLNRMPLSLIMMDIDYFKAYNDTYGHIVGDDVLCLVVKAIKSHIKNTDLVGRWGGEEFAVALPGAATSQALIVAERIRSTLAEMHLTDRDGNPINKPTMSQGIATFPQDVKDAIELVDLADQTLYIAKQRGRDQIMVAAYNHQPANHLPLDETWQ